MKLVLALLFMALPLTQQAQYQPEQDNYCPINKSSYGFRHYASKLEEEFINEIDVIALQYRIDANEMLALMHHESLFNPGAFNINRDGFSENGYTALGDGGVGLLGFMEYWTGFMHPYHVSKLSRTQQLVLVRIKLHELRSAPETSAILNRPGGFAYFVMGSHRGTPESIHAYLCDVTAYHPAGQYYTRFKTPYGGAKWNKKTRNFVSAFDEAYKIEQWKWHEDYIYLMEKL